MAFLDNFRKLIFFNEQRKIYQFFDKTAFTKTYIRREKESD